MDESAGLRAANLSTPVFRESWRSGAPLDWCEFITSWQAPPSRDGGRAEGGGGSE